MNKILYTCVNFFLITQFNFAEVSVKILDISGEAKVRFGLEEKWNKASAGINLKLLTFTSR